MENLRIFDTIEDYFAYKESNSFEMPSVNVVRYTPANKEATFVDNGINHNILWYTGGSKLDSVTTYGNKDVIFSGTYNGKKYLVLDNPLHQLFTTVYSEGFGFGPTGNDSLYSIILPDNIETIYEGSFLYSTSLNNIVLPKFLKRIGDSAFGKCDALTQIMIPKYTSNIDYAAFTTMANLEVVDFESKHLEYLEIDDIAFSSLPKLNTIISRSELPFKCLSSNSFYDTGYNTTTEKRLYVPFNCDERGYNNLLKNNLSGYVLANKISNVTNFSRTLSATPINAISSSVQAIPWNATEILAALSYGGSFYDVLGEKEYYNEMKEAILSIPIQQNNTYNTKTYSVNASSRKVLNVDTGQDLDMTATQRFVQWGKPHVVIEYEDSTAGFYNLGTVQLKQSNSSVLNKTFYYFKSRNYNMHNTNCKMKIRIKNKTNPKVYVNNYAESTYDYIRISKLDQDITTGTDVTSTYFGRKLSQLDPTFYSNFSLASYNITNDSEHYITAIFSKDGTTSSYNDAGYILFDVTDYQNCDFEVIPTTKYIGNPLYSTTITVNPKYSGVPNCTDAYYHGTTGGTYNGTLYRYYNCYNLALSLTDHYRITPNSTSNANYELEFDITAANSGVSNSFSKTYIPYHTSSETASSSTKTMSAGDKFNITGFYDNNSIYFDIKQSGFKVKRSSVSYYDACGTNYPTWYLDYKQATTTTKVQGTHTVSLTPRTTSHSGFACSGWAKATESSTKIKPSEVVSNTTFGNLYYSLNSGVANSVSIMEVNVSNYNKFTMYARSSGQASYDYLVISKPNVSLDNFMADITNSTATYTLTSFKSKNTTSSISKSLFVAGSFTRVEIDQETITHTATNTNRYYCAFKKNGSTNSYHDAGFIFIPN